MKGKVWKELTGGISLGVLTASVLAGAGKISAASAKALPAEYLYYCEKSGQEYGICPELLQAVIEEESGGSPDAVGQAGETGLMQIYPKYHRIRAEHLGVYNLFDPEGNILVGADYLAELFEMYQDTGTVLMVYNGTEDAAERGRKGDYTEYAEKIMERAARLERQHGK